MEKFLGENVRSTPTFITESHVILGGGVAAGCLFTFVGASRGYLCDSTAFLQYSTIAYTEHTGQINISHNRANRPTICMQYTVFLLYCMHFINVIFVFGGAYV